MERCRPCVMLAIGWQVCWTRYAAFLRFRGAITSLDRQWQWRRLGVVRIHLWALAVLFWFPAISGRCASGAPTTSGHEWQVEQSGPIKLRFTLPADRDPHAEPLLSIGQGGRGDIVFIYYQPGNRVSLGWEQAGGEVLLSDPQEVPADAACETVISLGSLMPSEENFYRRRPELIPLRGAAVIQFAGRTVLSARGVFAPGATKRVVAGANVVGGAMATAYFRGRIEEVTTVDPAEVLAASVELRQLAGPVSGRGPNDGGGATPATQLWNASTGGTEERAGYPGPVRIRLRFPRGRAGQTEPLVVTGVTGAGDIVYVRYESDHRLRFGFDHWSVGGPVSELVEIDPDRIQEIVLSMGSMLPPPAGSEPYTYAILRRQCLIFLNGRQALKWFGQFYPARPSQILIGVNAIGGSTAGPRFSGVIIRIEPMPPANMPKTPTG